MEAKELRIGNWILLKSKDKNFQITSGYEIDTGCDSDDFKPIPLTEEWLLRLGAYSIQDGWYKIKKSPIEITWNIYDKVARLMGYSFKNIKYVHQLQNLYFALTGEELIINPLINKE